MTGLARQSMTNGVVSRVAPGMVGVDAAWPPAGTAGVDRVDDSDGLFSNIRRKTIVTARPICCLAIDAEEDFDWDRPVRDTGYSTECMRHVTDLQEILGAYQCRPTYMLTYPVLEDAVVVRMLRGQYERGECELGLQLHPWVTPPFDGGVDHGSYLGNLEAVAEERKLLQLMGKFRNVFKMEPVTFRADSVDDVAIRARIGADFTRYGREWCPHTATAAEVYGRLSAAERREHPWVLVATAHPAKFNEVVEPIIGKPVDVPNALDRLLRLPRHFMDLPPTLQAVAAALE